MTPTRTRLLFGLASGGLLLLAWLIYAPGLHGTFLFDDFANLPALGAGGPVDTWPVFWRYITSGHADPTGRPLALLSFLIDAHDWPASPWPFKRTNVVLHLLNGVLLGLLLRQLGRALFPAETGRTSSRVVWRMDLAALLGAAFWLLHPLMVSTTLYIVQREAMLPATFTLLGLLLWLRGRSRLLAGHRIIGLVWIALGLGACTVLGILSKANGILLPALALVIEYTVLRHPCRRPGMRTPCLEAKAPWRTYRWAMGLLAWVPTTIVAIYLLDRGWRGLAHGISATRPWTLGQRLLTEPRVLMDYLGLLWLPRPFTPGLFNDHVLVSTSLLTPAATLPAILAVLGLIVGACLLRRRWPAAALAVLFYFVGQSLESSTIALELYFEHRNYLPAMLMFWPLALWLSGVRQAAMADATATTHSDPWRKAKWLLVVLLIAGLSLMTFARASLWGNAHDQGLLWAHLNPQSARAQATAAQVQMDHASPAEAVRRLQPRLARAPDEVQLALNLFGAQCQLGHVDQAALTAANTALRSARDSGTLLTSWFNRAIAQTRHPSCPQLNLDTLDAMLTAALANPHLQRIAGRRQDLYSLQGEIALARGNGHVALTDFNRALDQQVRIAVALQQAAQLGSAGYPALGLAHLDHLDQQHARVRNPKMGMARIHAWVLRRQHYWQKEQDHLRATLRADVENRKKAD